MQAPKIDCIWRSIGLEFMRAVVVRPAMRLRKSSPVMTMRSPESKSSAMRAGRL